MLFNSRRSPVLGKKGIVSTSQPLAAMAGMRMLLNGGNAVDAAVATAATLNVVEPGSTGIGGDLFALVWNEKEKQITGLNASGRASIGSSIEEVTNAGHSYIPNDSAYGVTVPGTVDGWCSLVDSFGSIPLREVLEPAIQYAEEGFVVSPIIANDFKGAFQKLARYPSGQELLIHGRPPRTGELMKIPELANSLRLIAEGGADAFYRGPLAKTLSEYVLQRGGWLTTQDFAQHSSTWDEPISTDYRGITCWECPPNGQGLNALMALNIAEGFDLAGSGFQSLDYYHYLIESMRLAFADGLHYITDPQQFDVPVEKMLSKSHGRDRRLLISQDHALPSVSYDLNLKDSDTVYVTCVDEYGNACSLINSLFQGFGSGLVAPGTGIVLQNRGISFSLNPEHPNSLQPSKRPFHTIIPGMATINGELWLSYGVMGGFQQAQGHLQVLVNMIDFGLDPQSALDARRFNVNLDDSTSLEQDFHPEIIAGLRSRGHRITTESGSQGLFFGGGQIIERNPETKTLIAGSDPRKDGCAIAW